MWNFLNFHPKIFKFALAAVGTGTLGFLFCFWPSVRSQFSAIIASFTDASGETVHDITLAAMFFAAFFVFILFVLEFLLKCHWPVYVVTLPVFAAAPVFGVSCGFFSVTFMVIFHVFFTARQCMKTRKRYSFSYKFKPGTKRENNIPAAMACFAVLIFVISMLVVSVSPQSFYNIVYTAEGFVYRNARQLSSNESDPVATGLISTGNNYRTGEVQMDVYASRQPTVPVYLKTFSGGDYTGGQWTEADDGPIFSNIALALGWQRWADWVQPLYDSLYYIMNDETAPEGTPDPITLTVHHTSGDYYNYYLPYNGYWSMYFQNYGQGYTYNYYEGKDMHIDWENYQPQFEVRRNWYAMIQQEYMKESVDVYTPAFLKILFLALSVFTGKILWKMKAWSQHLFIPFWKIPLIR